MLLDDVSLEITARDVDQLPRARARLASGTRIHITDLAGEDSEPRVSAAGAIARLGLTPVPHIAARRLRSTAELDGFLGALAADGAGGSAFVIAGDPARAQGPYADALAVIRSGVLDRRDVRRVAVAGYPEGHPTIDDAALWAALETKVTVLTERGFDPSVTTQFGFDADRVLDWIEQVRGRGIEVPIRVGVPGPTSVGRLLAFARRCGVGASSAVARKYGLSLANVLGTAGPDRFLNRLADGYDAAQHGAVGVHLYTFGGVDASVDWLASLASPAQAA